MILSKNDSMLYTLTSYEKSLYYCSKLGDGNVIGIAILASDEKVILEENVVKKAICYMKKRHPLLRASIYHDPNSTSVSFITKKECIDKIDLEWSQVESKFFLAKQLAEFNSKLFDYENNCLLWRCKVIEFKDNNLIKYCLAFVMPLFITDGINITTLTIEIVNIINSILNEKLCEEMKICLDLVDNLHVLSKKYKLFTDKQKYNLNQSIINQSNNSFRLADELKCPNESGLKINLMRMSRNLTDRLIKITKERKIKVTGFINTAIIYALRELYIENNLEFPNDITCGMPANLRLRYHPNLDFSHIRFQVCLVHLNLSYPFFGEFKSIWKDSVYVNKEIEKSTNIENGNIFITTHDKKTIEENNRIFEDSYLVEKNNSTKICEKMNEKNHCDLIVSNIGTYVNDRKKCNIGKFKISELYYGDSLVSNPNMISALILHIANWNGEIQMLLSSNLSVIGSIYVNRLIYIFKRILIQSLFD